MNNELNNYNRKEILEKIAPQWTNATGTDIDQFIKEQIIEKIAQKLTDDADIDTLMCYFYQGQMDYLDNSDASIEELLETAKELDIL